MKYKAILGSFVIGLGLSFFFLIPRFITNNTRSFLNEIQQELQEKSVQFTFGHIKTSWYPLELEITDVRFRTGKTANLFSLERLSLTKWSLLDAVEVIQGEFDVNQIKELRISINELQTDELLLPTQLSSIVRSLGYKNVTFNLIADFNYDKDRKKLKVNEVAIESPEIASVKMNFLLNEFDLDVLKNLSTPEEQLTYFNDISLDHFNIEFKEISLIKRYKNFISNTFSIDPMKTLSFLRPRLTKKRIPANENVEVKLKESLYEFLKNPETFYVSLNPERGLTYKDISIMMMLAPERLTESLNLSVEVNGKKF